MDSLRRVCSPSWFRTSGRKLVLRIVSADQLGLSPLVVVAVIYWCLLCNQSEVMHERCGLLALSHAGSILCLCSLCAVQTAQLVVPGKNHLAFVYKPTRTRSAGGFVGQTGSNVFSRIPQILTVIKVNPTKADQSPV